MLDVLDKKSVVKTKEDFVSIVEEIDKFKTLNYSKKRKNDKEKVLASLKIDLDFKLKKKNLLAP